MRARERLAGAPSSPEGSRFARPAPPACGLDQTPPPQLFGLPALMALRVSEIAPGRKKKPLHRR